MKIPMKRREFIKTAAVTGVAAAIMPKTLFSSQTVNERIKLGFIGTGLRGQWVLWLAAKYPEVGIPAICDIDDGMIESALKILKDAGKPEPKVYKKGDEDFRNMMLMKIWMECTLPLPGNGMRKCPWLQ